jgi:predicted membrane protein
LRFKTRDLALICVFAALYAVLSVVSLFSIIGDVGKSIALSSFLAPFIGMMLGPYIGVVTVSIGGFLGWSVTQTGTFSFLSFMPGAFSALSSGLLFKRRRALSLVLYMFLFLPMAFYPTIGPVWLYPAVLWFQLIGLVVLASPLASVAVSFVQNNDLAKLSLGVGVISFVSTMTGQIAGSLMFEATRWPIIYPQVEFWRDALWLPLTFAYPLERIIITFLAMTVGVALVKSLRAYGFKMGGN